MSPREPFADGSEDNPIWVSTGPFQYHITRGVTWAFWKYYQVTKDEYAENIDNDAYTNGMAITVLNYATKAAGLLGISANPDWIYVAANIPIEQFSDGTTEEYRGYDGQLIKRADVNLLSFPLDIIREEDRLKKRFGIL